ncbi:MAG: putative Glucose-6-phosphate isomerase (modular protein) [Nitrospira sp.]|jgi:glucose-6-phosphate isomerase/transaldolase/glucose-6-phosphate isomerase|nr:putative Glucose-6-phosphate isomerase (modular protein) [Nitrospira sp.]
MPTHPIAAHILNGEAVSRTLDNLTNNRAIERIWARDHTLWKPNPAEIENRLGWLNVLDHMQDGLADLRAFARSTREARTADVVLLGMGGSSLGPEVLRCTFGSAKGSPRLWILDSTVPGWVRHVTNAIHPARTLFLVASKSGGTIEVMSLFGHFRELVRRAKGNRGGRQFVAITDPGTGLEQLAREQGFSRTFINPPDIGGRYSVLSYFGLVPASLLGIDVEKLLARARAMRESCRETSSVRENPGAALGGMMGAMARTGRDKITLITSPALNSFGLWVEQLLAESTGKEGTGIIPVAGEPTAIPKAYGADRVFVYMRLKGDRNISLDRAVMALQRSGHPILRLELKDRYDLGGEFFRWEFAVAIAGHVLGINPFDQPNVQESKDNTARVLKEVETKGTLPLLPASSSKQSFLELLDHAAPNRYLAMLVYSTPSPQVEAALRTLRKAAMMRHHLATTAGYGPRYLHSTGQLHKGGPNSGLFLELVDTMRPDLPVPEKPYTFGTLAQAQAIGDLQSLHTHQRQAVHIALGRNPAGTIRSLITLLAPNKSIRRKTAVKNSPTPNRRSPR